MTSADDQICLPITEPLTTDGGLVSIHENSNLVLALSGFEKDGNLVSFALGEMFVHSSQL